jgi:hypothetical protein
MEVKSDRGVPSLTFELISAFEQVFLDSAQKYGKRLTYKSG